MYSDFGINLVIRLGIIMDKFSFFTRCSRCGSQVNLSSIIIPRNLTLSTLFSLCPAILTILSLPYGLVLAQASLSLALFFY